LAADDDVSPWDWSATLRGGGGYKDNLLLSDLFKESSAFSFVDVDAFLFRAPVNGWEFTGFVSGEDRRYWQSDIMPKEQFLLVSAELKKSFAERWKAGVNAQYFYDYQIFDASVTEGLPFRVRASLNRFSTSPSLQYDLHHNRRLEFSFTLLRQEYQKPLDDSWELGPRLLFAQKYGVGSEFSASLQWRHRTYDERASPGSQFKSLTFDVPEFELGISHYWDEAKHWRSRGRLGFEVNEDNGDGFFDYRRYKISNELGFTQGGFEGMLQAKFLHYEYTHQIATNGRARRRSELDFGARAKEQVFKGISLFAEFEHEWVLATDTDERYHATTIWGGIEWEVK
jgi:hypothetical protein